MIRRAIEVDCRAAWLLVTQRRHADLAWRLAAAAQRVTGDDELERQYLAAVRRHDDGWRQPDGQLPRDAAGKPYTFFEFTPRFSLEPWRRSLDSAVRWGDFCQWLVAEHFLRLGADAASESGGVPGLREFLVEQRPRQAERLGDVDPATADAYLRRLRLFDAISLACCGAFGRARSEFSEGGAAAVVERIAEQWNDATRTWKSCWRVQCPMLAASSEFAWKSPALLLDSPPPGPTSPPRDPPQVVSFALTLTLGDSAR